ncbi:MAG: hypothetical protein ACHBNF_18235 [Chromatiales bacterium]
MFSYRTLPYYTLALIKKTFFWYRREACQQETEPEVCRERAAYLELEVYQGQAACQERAAFQLEPEACRERAACHRTDNRHRPYLSLFREAVRFQGR